MDSFSKSKRSEIMSRIRSKNTGIEKAVFLGLRRRKVYFQKHYKKVAGNPDIALPSKKKAIFIDGDFWHGYNFSKTKSRLPKKYWQQKIENNIKRDKRINRTLRREGWTVIRIWEHEIKRHPEKALNRIAHELINKRV